MSAEEKYRNSAGSPIPDDKAIEQLSGEDLSLLTEKGSSLPDAFLAEARAGLENAGNTETVRKMNLKLHRSLQEQIHRKKQQKKQAARAVTPQMLVILIACILILLLIIYVFIRLLPLFL